jgi:POT family proton-dependent oligopeptide transporter
MLAGVVQFVLTRHHLGGVGTRVVNPSPTPVRDWTIVAMAVLGILIVAFLAMSGWIALDAQIMARYAASVILGAAILWFLWAFTWADLDSGEQKRIFVLLILFLSSALFWSGFEQAGSSMNLFAKSHTDRTVLGREFPAGWLQSANALFILIFAPVVSALWLALARRDRSPSLNAKMAGGLVLLGVGFVVMNLAAGRSVGRSAGEVILVSPWWLIATYLLHTFGELFLSPVGLSAVSKLAPARLAGQMMGIWFLATSLGNLMAGLLSSVIMGGSAADMPAQFLQLFLITSGAGLLLLVLSPWIRRLIPGIE